MRSSIICVFKSQIPPSDVPDRTSSWIKKARSHHSSTGAQNWSWILPGCRAHPNSLGGLLVAKDRGNLDWL